jgi:hypothetical protein
MWVCGRVEVDLELLKRNTKYGGNDWNENSQVIKWFWEVMEEMNNTDR